MAVPTPTMPGAGPNELVYRGQALAQLRILKQQMQLGGLKIGSRMADLGNGVTCFCNICFNREDVYVKVPAVVVEGVDIPTVEYLFIRLTGEENAPVFDGSGGDGGKCVFTTKSGTATESINVDLANRDNKITKKVGTQNWQNGAGSIVSWYWDGTRYDPDGAASSTIYFKDGKSIEAPGLVLGAGLRGTAPNQVLFAAIDKGGLFWYNTTTSAWVEVPGITFETRPVFFTYSCDKCGYIYVYDMKDREDRNSPATPPSPPESETVVVSITGGAGSYSCTVGRESHTPTPYKIWRGGHTMGEDPPEWPEHYDFCIQDFIDGRLVCDFDYTGMTYGLPAEFTGTYAYGDSIPLYMDATDEILVSHLLSGSVEKNVYAGALSTSKGVVINAVSFNYGISTSFTLLGLKVLRFGEEVSGSSTDLNIPAYIPLKETKGVGVGDYTITTTIPILWDLRLTDRIVCCYESVHRPDDMLWKRGMYFVPNNMSNKLPLWEQETSVPSTEGLGDGVYDYFESPFYEIIPQVPYKHIADMAAQLAIVLNSNPVNTRIFASIAVAIGVYRSFYYNDDGTDLNAADHLSITNKFFWSDGVLLHKIPLIL